MKKRNVLFGILSVIVLFVSGAQMMTALFSKTLFQSNNRIILSCIEYIPILFLAILSIIVSFGLFPPRYKKGLSLAAALLFIPQTVYRIVLLIKFVPLENSTPLFTTLSYVQLVLNILLFSMMIGLLFCYYLGKTKAYQFVLIAFLVFMAISIVVNIYSSNIISRSLWGSVVILLLQLLVCTPFILYSLKGSRYEPAESL